MPQQDIKNQAQLMASVLLDEFSTDPVEINEPYGKSPQTIIRKRILLRHSATLERATMRLLEKRMHKRFNRIGFIIHPLKDSPHKLDDNFSQTFLLISDIANITLMHQ